MRSLGALVGAAMAIQPQIFFAQGTVPRTSRIVGIVIDSLHQSGLEGAEVMASGLASPSITDSLGRFSIDSLVPGTYQLGVFHPFLQSLGLTLTTRPFSVGPDSTGVANLAIPSGGTLARRYCGGAVTSARPAVVAGRVLDPDNDRAVPGATVSLAWVDIVVTKETGIVRTPHDLHTVVDSAGFFRFCGLPEDLDATVQASHAGVWTGEVTISTRASPLTFENLALATNGDPPKGAVRGIVASVYDKPLSRARVEVPMSGVAVLTREDGSFNLDGVTTGTQLIVVRHLGFDPTRVAVNVTSRQAVDVRVTLAPRENVLDPVFVTARANYTLEKVGFASRQRLGWGTYFTREKIQKRNPSYLTDLLAEVPYIRVIHTIGGTAIQDQRPRSILNAGRGGSCTHVWVDGFEWRIADAGDLDSFLSPRDLLGLEVYRGLDAPARYRPIDDANCRAVVILAWTR